MDPNIRTSIPFRLCSLLSVKAQASDQYADNITLKYNFVYFK
jgi:hypothetical protein